MRTAVMGEGEGVGGAGSRTGGSENIFWREAVPRRVVGRAICELPESENTGPAYWKSVANRSQKICIPPRRPVRRLASSSPPCSISSSVATGVLDGTLVGGDSESVNGWPTDAKKRRNGWFGCVRGRGFSRSVADTVKHNNGSETFNRKKALGRTLSRRDTTYRSIVLQTVSESW
jgi:hypothetical protein